jgi:hypothetical protein
MFLFCVVARPVTTTGTFIAFLLFFCICLLALCFDYITLATAPEHQQVMRSLQYHHLFDICIFALDLPHLVHKAMLSPIPICIGMEVYGYLSVTIIIYTGVQMLALGSS